MEVDGVALAIAGCLICLAWVGGGRHAINRARSSKRFRQRHGIPQ